MAGIFDFVKFSRGNHIIYARKKSPRLDNTWTYLRIFHINYRFQHLAGYTIAYAGPDGLRYPDRALYKPVIFLY